MEEEIALLMKEKGRSEVICLAKMIDVLIYFGRFHFLSLDEASFHPNTLYRI